MTREKILEIQNLSVRFHSARGAVYAVNDISYDVYAGEVLGIVGESGSGKSTSAYALTRLLPENGKVSSGKILYKDRSILDLSDLEMRKMRGEEIAMIFQNPMQCLDPVFTIGSQLIEMIQAHEPVSKKDAWYRAVNVLRSVQIKAPERMMRSYQHELSGGMCQRVMIAMAMLLGPKLLIADEPTTALDVTIQDQILGLIQEEIRSNDMSVIFITHNLGIVADICDRVCVMYGGRIVETGTVDEIFYDQQHPYTRGLLDSIPKPDVFDKSHLSAIEGSPIDMTFAPKGCPFSPRCAYSTTKCMSQMPPDVILSETHRAACWKCQEEKGAQA